MMLSCGAFNTNRDNISHIFLYFLQIEVAENKSAKPVVTESFCQLEGHTNRITGLCWSTHKEGMLASASYDWTSQVSKVNCVSPEQC